MSFLSRLTSIVIIALSGCFLAACGGGGGSSEGEALGDTPAGPGAPVADQSASLTWTIPSTREGGEDLELSDLSGYEIQYRKQGEELFESVLVDSPTATEFEVQNLERGIYEFKISAYDNDGMFSGFSNVIVAAVPRDS